MIYFEKEEKQMTLTEILKRAANSETGVTFLSKKEHFYSYGELYQKAKLLLGGMQDLGLKASDYLIFQIYEPENFVLCLWASLLGGIIPVPLPVALDEEKQRKLQKVLELLPGAWLISEERIGEKAKEFISVNPKNPIIQFFLNKALWVEQLLETKKEGIEWEVKEKDLAIIQFSSGSTGSPKGVLLNHENITENIKMIAGISTFREDDKLLSWLPLTHDMGLIGAHMTPIFLQLSQILLPTLDFMENPSLWLSAVSRTGASITLAPNFAYKAILAYLRNGATVDWNLQRLRLILNGAEPISVEVCKSFLKALKPYGLAENCIVNGYGMAEASLLISVSEPLQGLSYKSFQRSSLSLGAKVEVDWGKQGKTIVDVGQPLPGCAIRIGDGNGKLCDTGKVGEIEIKGKSVCSGYIEKGETAKDLFTKDGWLKTGDIGFFYQGKLYISGRKKEIIFLNGQNYYPYDIEEVLEKGIPAPQGSLSISAISGEHEEDRLFLFVKVNEKEKAIYLQKAREILLEQFGIFLEGLIPLEELPKTESGKIKRTILKKMLEEGQFTILLGRKEAESNLVETKKIVREEVSDKILEKKARIEIQLVKYCGEILEVEPESISRLQAFWDLGFNSFKMSQLKGKIEESFHTDISMKELFACQNIAKLASYLGAEEKKTIEIKVGESVKGKKEDDLIGKGITRQKEMAESTKEIAYLFSGQGSQSVGMAKLLLEQFVPGNEYFLEAEEICKIPLKKLCLTGTVEDLKDTMVTQPAILLCSYLWFLHYKDSGGPLGQYYAGHSLGEYTALLAAGVLSFSQAIKLIKRRAEIMKMATDQHKGGMLVFRNGKVEELYSYLQEARYNQKMQIDLACLNSPKQIVLSGEEKDIHKFGEIIIEKNLGEIVFLKLSGAFHSRFMKEASALFRQNLEEENMEDPKAWIISNLTAKPYRSVEEIKDNLVKQLYSPVHWWESMQFFKNAGVREFVEFGPKATLIPFFKEEEDCHGRFYQGKT